MVDRDLRRAIKASGYNRTSCAHRRVADHGMVFPRTGAKAPRQHRIKRNWYLTWQTDLAAMCMPAQQQIKFSVRSLLVNFGRVG